jgi:gliding motility-associated protein GldM
MAGGKLSPRQKMIGMMYLVLTALLALNVSKEILDAFVTINAGLENTGLSFDKDIAGLYARFDEKKSIDPLRVTPNWEKAQEAKRMSKEINQYIDQLKKRLIRETEGFANHEEDTARLMYVNGKDNYDIPTDILIGQSEDGSAGESRVLKNKLNEYKTNLLALLPENTASQLHLNIDTEDPKDGGETHTWEMRNFYHSPLVASVTILSKIQDDLKSAETDVVYELLKATDSDIIPFDTVAARVVAPTSYVLLGEEYNADIFLAAFNKTLVPQVYIGDYDPATGKMSGAYDSVPVFNGLGKYNLKTDKEGVMTYEGVINMKTPKGTFMQFPFESQYIVARPSATASADKMNVMYAGLENPITVSVPGVPNEKVRVSCDNGTLTPLGGGKYNVTGPKAGMCHINISAETDSGVVRSMGVQEFRVKNLPAPMVYPSGVTTPRPTAAQIGNTLGLVCTYGPDFLFNARANVVSYDLTVMSNSGLLYSKDNNPGNQVPEQGKQVMRTARKGTKVIFSNIKAVGADGVQVKCPDATYTIN